MLQVTAMLMVLWSPAVAFSPLAYLKTQIGSFYDIGTKLSSDFMARNVSASSKNFTKHEDPLFDLTEGVSLPIQESENNQASHDNQKLADNQVLFNDQDPLSNRNPEISQTLPVNQDHHNSQVHGNTQQASYTLTASDTSFSQATTENSVLGSLFDLGVDDIEAKELPNNAPANENKSPIYHIITSTPKKNNKLSDVGILSPLKEILKDMNNMTFLPVVSTNGSSILDDKNNVNETPLLKYLDEIRGGAWAQFKAMALGYTNWLGHEYETKHISKKLPLNLIKKVLDLGDRVNFLQVVGKKVDPGLAEYLADQLQPLFSHFERLTASKLIRGGLSATVSGIVRDAAWKTIHQFVSHVLKVSGNVVSKEELENFKHELAKSSPMAAQGLDLVLNGPLQEDSAVEGRSWVNRNGYEDRHNGYSNDGYGNYGSHDESYTSYGPPSGGGYAAGVYLDPYLLLAGLGASVLLAFLAYRVIVTTEGTQRSFNELTLMDLSDVPSVIYTLHSLLDDAENKYKSKRSLPSHERATDDTLDDFPQGLNELWREHQSDSGCVRCALFTYALDHSQRGYYNHLNGIIVSGTAHLLGAQRSGQLMDEVMRQVLDDLPVSCEQEGHSCTLK